MRLLSILPIALFTTTTGCSLIGMVTPGAKSSTPSETAPTTADAPAGASDGTLHPGDGAYVDPGPHYGKVAERRSGQVVFSAAPIAMAAADDASAYASYELGKPLYMRYFGIDSPHNLMPSCDAPRNVLRVEVNGEFAGQPVARWESFGGYDVSDLNTRGASSLSNELELAFTTPSLWSTDRPVAGEEAVRRFNALVIPKLKEGPNQIRVAIQLMCSGAEDSDPVVAKGDLTVDVGPGAVASYLRKFGTTLGKSPHPENAKLVPKIIKVMREKSDWDNEEIIGASVTSDEWLPIRHEYSGRVIAYQVEAALIVRAKKETSPEACRLFSMAYSKDADGGPLMFAGTGDSTPFPCSNAPK